MSKFFRSMPFSGKRRQNKRYSPAWKGITPEVQRETRQQLRASMRRIAYHEITMQYPGEDHATRRSMAMSRARRDYRNLKGLPDPER